MLREIGNIGGNRHEWLASKRMTFLDYPRHSLDLSTFYFLYLPSILNSRAPAVSDGKRKGRMQT